MTDDKNELKISSDKQTPDSISNPIEQKSLADTINDIDSNKVQQIMNAVVTPFQKEGKQSRRDILLVFGGLLLLLIVLFAIMAFMKIIDTSTVTFFFGTAFGLLMGFISKYFIHD